MPSTTPHDDTDDDRDDLGDISGKTPAIPESTPATDRVVHLPFPGVDHDYGLSPRPRVRAHRVDPLLGLDLGGVLITRLIGEGGMGRVYEAHQLSPARTVAVKVVRQGITTEQTMRRFEREAEFLSRLQHSGIARIYIVGTYASDLGDVPFYVMEYIPDAKPITNYVHGRQLDLSARLGLFKQVCDAVAHGHDRGIVHRDLKPGNILIDGQGSPRVIDFGVARSMDSDLAITAMRTDTGQLVGTVQYMSPEQFGGDPEDLDSRCDVYSLGVVLYELISGEVPYNVRRKPLHEASRVVCEQVPVPLRTLDRTIPRNVSAIAEKCLQKDRRRRYHDGGHLAADVQRVLDGKPLEHHPVGFLGWLAGFRRHRRRRGSVIGILVLALCAIAACLRGVAEEATSQPTAKPLKAAGFPESTDQITKRRAEGARPLVEPPRETAHGRIELRDIPDDAESDSLIHRVRDEQHCVGGNDIHSRKGELRGR